MTTTGTDRRPLLVAIATLAAGAAVLAWSLRLPPGDDRFPWITLGLAAIWLAGAWATRRMARAIPTPALAKAGRHRGTASGPLRQALLGLGVGAALVAIFLVGAFIVAKVPALRHPVDALLAHARVGSLGLIALSTAVNGVAEEAFFRGGLYAALPHSRIVATTLLYTGVTALSGIFLLAFAGLILGLITALLRRATGGLVAPIVTHLAWSLSMLFLLPAALSAAA